MNKGFRGKNGGITLIALVITIIVLLILAGISISMLTGENGILTQAAKSKEETEQAKENELNILDDYETKLNEYAGIDWDVALANAQKHLDQTTSTAIGVGTNGKPVNMDLWECVQLEDKTCKIQYTANESDIVNGSIKGTVPQYIKVDGEIYTVTDMENAFINNSYLEYSPTIPSTVKLLNGTFAYCTNLKESPVIPYGVLEMKSTFAGCSNLEAAPEIPNSVTNLNSAFTWCDKIESTPFIPDSVISMNFCFNECTNLKNATNLPKYVESLYGTFNGCTSLGSVELVIPETAINIGKTFAGCTNLTGSIEINASVNGSVINGLSDYVQFLTWAATSEDANLKLSGNCEILVDIFNTKSSNSNITLIN